MYIYNNLKDYKNNLKYFCSKCDTPLKNVKNGCPSCGSFDYRKENVNTRYEDILRDNNLLSSLLCIIACLIITLGFLLGIVMGGNDTMDFNFIVALKYWIISDICSAFVFALSEIIKILHDIRYKIWLK